MLTNLHNLRNLTMYIHIDMKRNCVPSNSDYVQLD